MGLSSADITKIPGKFAIMGIRKTIGSCYHLIIVMEIRLYSDDDV